MSSSPETTRLFAAPAVAADVRVDLETSLNVSPHYACARLLSTNIASLTPHHYRRLKNGGRERNDTSAIARLLREPNPEQTRYKVIEQLVLHAACCGNAYAEITFTGGGQPAEIWPIDPRRVTVMRDAGGKKCYRVTQGSGGDVTLPARQMLHIQGPGWTGDYGFNMAEMARQALGLAIASEQYASKFFANGAQLGGVVTTDLTEQGRKNFLTAMNAEHQGVGRSHRWIVAPPGTSFTPIGVNMHDSQMEELRARQVDEICRFHGIAPMLIGAMGRATWGNFGEAREQFFTQTITPWLVNIESELMAKLISPLERGQQLIAFNVDGFLRGNPAERASHYQTMVQIGAYSINDVLALENRPPIAGGDGHLKPMNAEYITEPEPVVEPARAAITLAAHRDLLLDAFGRYLGVECDRASRCRTAPKLKEYAQREYDDQVHRAKLSDILHVPVRAWLATLAREDEADQICEALVAHHFETTYRVLKALADHNPSDTFGEVLDQQLRIWRQNGRIVRVVDHLIAHFAPPPLEALPTKPRQLAAAGAKLALMRCVHKQLVAEYDARLEASKSKGK
jgi:HK97 family phage portal protein